MNKVVDVITRQIKDAAQEDMFDWEVAQQIIAELSNAGYWLIDAVVMRDTIRSTISDLLFDHGTELDIPGGTTTLADAVTDALIKEVDMNTPVTPEGQEP